eukprot:CAMPEP_0204528952 /NCGR_PEP_ID=MMETSP0661-20131031/9800_1 /ASSEMBLY_ACC=CAM_ASM_000606 /TAXON_ID=109239 /ORGANISM="Alexandrium margalefi, Strain AMGDE01CS-322" /LENGTH=116 /DNA_ID=CAMNT_0051534955 /DNA_START=550 /DNA_END=901 /DNA_ORIENTATION=+
MNGIIPLRDPSYSGHGTCSSTVFFVMKMEAGNGKPKRLWNEVLWESTLGFPNVALLQKGYRRAVIVVQKGRDQTSKRDIQVHVEIIERNFPGSDDAHQGIDIIDRTHASRPGDEDQ